jgi:hypothetical protein
MESNYLNKIQQKQQQNREHILKSSVDNTGNIAKSEFFSKDKLDKLKQESATLEAKVEHKSINHDALHVLVQSKLDSIGVQHVRTTSMENEIMVNSMIRVSEKLNKSFGGSSEKSIEELMIKSVQDNYPDFQTNIETYRDYGQLLYKLFMQVAAVTKSVLQNEGDSFKEYIELTQEVLSEPENDVYGAGSDTFVNAGFSEDPELVAKYSHTVALINKTLDDIEFVKAFNGIE